MKKEIFLIAAIILLTCNTALYGINFSRVNIAWQYDVDFEVQMAHRVVNSAEGTIIFLKIKSDTLDKWNYEFLFQEDYDTEEDREVEPSSIDTLKSSTTESLLKLTFSGIQTGLIVVKFYKPENYYYYDIYLRIGSLTYPEIYPVDQNGLPILDQYINRSGHSWEGSDSYLAMQYKEWFKRADPPMADMKALAPQVDLDTAFQFIGSTSMLENHFYTIRKDSLANTGITMLRMPPYFPEYRQLNELVESMQYLTSEQEEKAMMRSKNPKQSFDSFWMNTYSTKSRARSAIRKYYAWIKKANMLFTDFKPGWKTDRGMMYIVFGKPDEVYRTGNLEEWYYDDGSAFEFTIFSTFFAPRTYALR